MAFTSYGGHFQLTIRVSVPGEEVLSVTPWSDAPYSIKRHGVTITNCDSEPVQTPGCVQSHGVMLVMRPADLTVLQVSENCARALGVPPDGALGKKLAALIGHEHAGRVEAHLRRTKTEANPLYVFSMSAAADGAVLDATVHTSEGTVILELEAMDRTSRDLPDYFALVRQAVGHLQAATTLRAFSEVVAHEVRELTGYDRVMIYRFHADGHGEVFAETKRDDLESWLGLHYPAEDIPLPAREIFRRTWVRPVPDVTGALAEMVPLANPETGKPVVMTYTSLRGPSVMYTEYLKNMGVTAACTVALRQGEQLWGLIACHHYSGVKQVPYELRAACELIGQVASLQLKSADEREHVDYRLRIEEAHREVLAHAALLQSVSAIVDDEPGLRAGIAASGVALRHEGKWLRAGRTPDDLQLDALAEWLGARPEAAQGLYVSDALPRAFEPASSYADIASGVLALPLSRSPSSWLMWFRPETLQTVNWGGDPNDKPMVTGPHGPRLTPRGSFALFSEQVRRRSLPWLAVEVDAAVRLRVQILELVVRRAEHLAALNAELGRSNEELDAFAYVASHDLKEPLRAIHKYAHQLAHDQGVSKDEAAQKLGSLMRLAVRMDGLLESLLHFARVGRIKLDFEPTPLGEVLDEAMEMVSSRTQDAHTSITAPRSLPVVTCDRVRVREMFVNLLSNALKYNDKPERTIEVGYVSPDEPLERPAAIGGALVFFVRDNGIGIQARHLEEVFKMFRRLHGRDEFGGGTGTGLTIVKKLVERHHGHIWVTSVPGQGTTFYFTLPGDGA